MEKIAVIGFENTGKIVKKYGGRAEFDIDVPCRTNAQNYAYSAVFIQSNQSRSVIKSWLGNEHLRLVADESALAAEIDFFLGIPEPLEIERKFLIEKPDEEMLLRYELCDFADIAQAYAENDGGRFRVRKRGRDGDFIYIKTEKIKLSEMKRIEHETRITQAQYTESIKGQKVLYKRRYLLLYGEKCFELDIFPFWQDKALLEIELKAETESFALPPFLKVIKEVTQDKAYRNSVLAKIYGIKH